MSKIALEGNASGIGTFTISAPNGNSNRTLSLPDETGTVLTSGGAIDVNASAPADSLAINASGNVGIGTSSPTSKLHVYGGAGTNIGIQSSAGRHWRLGDGVGATNGSFVIYDYTGSAKRLEIDASGNLLFNSGYGSAATAYGCRAWVNFNGTGTVAIRASGNVSSITDNGTGNYTVNFTTAMPDADYSVSASGGYPPIRDGGVYAPASQSLTTSAVRVRCFGSNAPDTPIDLSVVSVAVFR